jgi:hypothetical protein
MPWIVAKEDRAHTVTIGLICNYWFGFNVYDPRTDQYDFANRDPFTKIETDWMTTVIQTNQVYIYWDDPMAPIKQFHAQLQQARARWIQEINANPKGIASEVTDITHFTLTATPGRHRMPEIVADGWADVHDKFNITHLSHTDIPQPPILLERLRTGAVSIIVDSEHAYVSETCVAYIAEFPISKAAADLYRCITLSKYMGIHVEIWLNLHNYAKRYRSMLRYMVFVEEDLPYYPDTHHFIIDGKPNVCKSCRAPTWWRAYIVPELMYPEGAEPDPNDRKSDELPRHTVHCVVCVHYTKKYLQPCAIIPGSCSTDEQINRLTHPVDTRKFNAIMHILNTPTPDWVRTINPAGYEIYTYKNLRLTTNLQALDNMKDTDDIMCNGIMILE